MIRAACMEDFKILCDLDEYISAKALEKKIKDGEVFVYEEEGKIIGWLRYNFFGMSIPL
ncbi:MAG TPA: hypothetical protein PLL17_08195 [Defluviitaleaceae bacterium]|jgi:hypothetical protein|nr:hypothetical protein [Defluviitaleaceae bacterium]HQD51089.1 hypothetical protein [Defluviitaleaceae bacterium]